MQHFYGLKYVPPETEFESFLFELLNLINCIGKHYLKLYCII